MLYSSTFKMLRNKYILVEFFSKNKYLNVRKVNIVVFLQADQICYAVLCVFSYVAAGMEQQQLLEASRIKGRIYRTL